ncbi:hypothetical protein GBAR_LOCUS4408, partial [Geodia barretti]
MDGAQIRPRCQGGHWGACHHTSAPCPFPRPGRARGPTSRLDWRSTAADRVEIAAHSSPKYTSRCSRTHTSPKRHRNRRAVRKSVPVPCPSG